MEDQTRISPVARRRQRKSRLVARAWRRSPQPSEHLLHRKNNAYERSSRQNNIPLLRICRHRILLFFFNTDNTFDDYCLWGSRPGMRGEQVLKQLFFFCFVLNLAVCYSYCSRTLRVTYSHSLASKLAAFTITAVKGWLTYCKLACIMVSEPLTVPYTQARILARGHLF